MSLDGIALNVEVKDHLNTQTDVPGFQLILGQFVIRDQRTVVICRDFVSHPQPDLISQLGCRQPRFWRTALNDESDDLVSVQLMQIT